MNVQADAPYRADTESDYRLLVARGSTGDVLLTMEGLSDKELPSSRTYEWTEFGIFLTPVFFYVIRGLVGGRTPIREPATVAADGPSRSNGVTRPVLSAPSNGQHGT